MSKSNSTSGAEERPRGHVPNRQGTITHCWLTPAWAEQNTRGIERCRNELSGWRTYTTFDPRIAMRRTVPPPTLMISASWERILTPPFLYRLKEEKEHQKHSRRLSVRCARSFRVWKGSQLTSTHAPRYPGYCRPPKWRGLFFPHHFRRHAARACAMHHRSQSMGRIVGSLRRARKRCPSTAAES